MRTKTTTIRPARLTRSVALLSVFLTLCLAHQAPGQSFTKVTTGPPVTETGAWRSVNWIDYDRDGDLDLFVTRGLSGGQDNVLFRNDGAPAFSFTRMSSLVISQDHESSDGATWADYDNDGYPDAFVVNWYNRNNLLYHNNGDGTFTRITSGAPVTDGGYSETASWGDYDNDGLVDLYVSNSEGSLLNFLYRNAGGGSFVKITAGRQSTDEGTSRGVNWVDYDGDGDLDLFVANESNENDFLYRNMRLESGVDTFARVGAGPLVSSGGSSWSGSWADYDNDGDQDVFVANQGLQAGRLFVNDGAGGFTADTASPLATDQAYGASACWGDFDNDGDLDLLVTQAYSPTARPSRLYRNMLAETDTARFESVLTGPLATDAGYQYGAAWGDYDGDGDLDLFAARTFNESQVNVLYRNDGALGHWLTLDLRGTASNAAAIGAKARVKASIGGTPVWQLRAVEGQSGYCGQNLQLHFGLGDASTVDSLMIEWPSGELEAFANLGVDRHFVAVEDDSTHPSAVSPESGFVNDAPTIRLSWTRSLHYPPYRLQVSTDAGFAGPMVADTVVGDSAALISVIPTGDRYYWRVTPERSIRGPLWSETSSFDNAVLLPGTTTPIAPADAAVNVPTTPTLRWTRALRATGYHLRLSPDSTFAAAVLDTVVADTAFPAGPLQNDMRIFWSVEAVNFTGSGPLSPVRSFRTIIAAPALPVQTSPAQGETDVPAPAVLRWNAADRAALYRVQLSPESLFVPPFLQESLVADTLLEARGLASLAVYYWRLRSVNVGGQSSSTATRSFSTGLAAPEGLEPADDAAQFTDVRFSWRPAPPAISYQLQYGTDSIFAAPVFDDSTLTETSYAVSLDADIRYFWRIRAIHPQRTSPWTPTRSFVTTPDTFTVGAIAAWNLVSLPGNLPDRSASALFPGAMTPFYRYDGSYHSADTLEYGTGYWVRFPPGSLFAIAGTKRYADTIQVSAGWNLIAPISVPVGVPAIATVPAGIVSSPFFGYDGGFRREDTLRPGRGYWIRMQQAGELVLSAADPPAPEARLVIAAGAAVPPPPPGESPAPDLLTGIPERTELFPNYPNPFNPSTSIRFALRAEAHSMLEVFALSGERVALLADGILPAGTHTMRWDAGELPAGVYFCRLNAGTDSGVQKLLLMK